MRNAKLGNHLTSLRLGRYPVEFSILASRTFNFYLKLAHSWSLLKKKTRLQVLYFFGLKEAFRLSCLLHVCSEVSRKFGLLSRMNWSLEIISFIWGSDNFSEKLILAGAVNDSFLSYFFVKKYLLVGASGKLWTGQWASEWVSEWGMYVCHTNQIGSTINSQSNFLF